MTNVVKIAKEHLDTLETRIGKLEDFIRMAEALLKHDLSNSAKASDADYSKPAESTGSAKGSSFSKTTKGDDAEAESEDLPVRELNVRERVFKSRATHNEPPPERHYPSMGRLHP